MALRTRPLEALVIEAYVRGLSDRDIESLLAEAGLGHVSKSAVSELCRELRARYAAFCARSLAGVELVVLFLDTIYLPTRPNGAKEGVLVAWGYTTAGQRVLVAVWLGQRERHKDWLDLGRDLARRGLPTPLLVVGDGAPGLIKAVDELWPEADRQRCTVHRLRNLLAKLPRDAALLERVRRAYWAALDEAVDPADAERRLRDLVGELERHYPSAAACLAEDLPALCVHLRYAPRCRKRLRSTNLLERSLEEVRRRTKAIGRFPGETSLSQPLLGRTQPRRRRRTRPRPHQPRTTRARRPARQPRGRARARSVDRLTRAHHETDSRHFSSANRTRPSRAAVASESSGRCGASHRHRPRGAGP